MIHRIPDTGGYSSDKLFDKLRNLSSKVLCLVLLKAFILFEMLKKHDIPVQVRVAIIAALAYLISPVDGIPDVLPGGLADDIAVMTGVLATIDHLVTDDVKKRAQERADRFTGYEDDTGEEEPS